jgi:hypothetical protein
MYLNKYALKEIVLIFQLLYTFINNSNMILNKR